METTVKNNVIQILSDSPSTGIVLSALNGLSEQNFSVNTFRSNFTISGNGLTIIYITNSDSELFRFILEQDRKKDRFVFYVINNDNASLGITLAKLGFENVYALPADKKDFREKIKNRLNDNSLYNRKSFSFIDERNYAFDSILGNSPTALKMIELAKRVAKSPATNVLIIGETGTGKGMLAKAIHLYGNQSDAPFVDVMCTAIPENLLEAELFGYVKGAFTGAKENKPGLFEIANGGTIFLDEIGDLSLEFQAKLLRAVEKKIIRRIGGTKDLPINVRIISATNKNLEELVKQKLFRSDLYYRLNIVTLYIPPLRERGDDILKLTENFVLDFGKKLGITVKKIEPELLQFLIQYPWPGNIRELKNAIERAIVLTEDGILKFEHFKSLTGKLKTEKNIKSIIDSILLPDQIRLDVKYKETDLKTLNKNYASEVLKKMNYNKSKTAKLLGITRPTLDKLLR